MRKRAQRRFKTTFEEPRHRVEAIKPEQKKKPIRKKYNYWIALTLIGLFLMIIFLNTFYNVTREVTTDETKEGLDKYYLSGPDPYYNRRLVEETFETGKYPYYSEEDPMLNYPHGALGARAPLFNMMTIGFSRTLTPFMDEIDALGRSMQFISALFGALIVFPVYFLGKTLFNKKVGIIAAFIVAIIPIHLGSGHGSAYSLFDHDSFNLFLFFVTFLFLIMSLKEKNAIKSTLYAFLGGISLAGLSMTWVEAQFLYVIIAIYAVIQIIFDIFLNKIEFRFFRSTSVILWTGYLVSLPIIAAKPGGILFEITIALCIGITAFGVLYYLFGKAKIPWTISLPLLFSFAVASFIFLYFVNTISKSITFLAPLRRLATVIFGEGIYGNKVSDTIAEAGTYQISHTVMSFGPAIYWIAWAGFIFLMWYYYKDKLRRDYLFIIVIFIVNIWLAGTAGRFLNDMVPLIAILSAWIIWFVIDKIDYKQMIRNIKSAGGGIHGIRRGVKIMHIFGILFIGFIVIMPNAFLAFDAAVPSIAVLEDEEGNIDFRYPKWEMFGEGHLGAFGLSVTKERYWSHAFEWLRSQDTNIKNPKDRPAFISWWDYGFYCAALSDHPTVADNFQDGIPPAANFHTATTEDEAVVVLTIRLLESIRHEDSKADKKDAVQVLGKYVDSRKAEEMISWIENLDSPSIGTPIGEEYWEEVAKDYPVGQQYPDNAVYHDIVEYLVKDPATRISSEQITWLYHDVQELTGYSIRYYGVEGYDRQIFNIFAFLSDKSTLLVGAPEDDYVTMYYTGYTVNSRGEVQEENQRWTARTLLEMDDDQRRFYRVTGSDPEFKDLFFDTMFYKVYVGSTDTSPEGGVQFSDYQVPCLDMKHFYAEYISDLTKPYLQYNFNGKAAVVIAKYYECAIVNGSLTFDGKPLNNTELIVQKNLSIYPYEDAWIDHDKTSITLAYENDTADFNLLVGADAIIRVRRYPELGGNAFIMHNITFNSTTDPKYYPITDDVAMRKTTDYVRDLGNVTIEPGVLSGYFYNDTDDNRKYNASIDIPIPNGTIRLWEINDWTIDENTQRYIPNTDTVTLIGEKKSNETTGYYNYSNLKPGSYQIEVFVDNFLNTVSSINIFSGENNYNLRQPIFSDVKGTTFIDENDNNEYDSGEELGNVDIDLIYKSQEDRPEVYVTNMTTSVTGSYRFTSLTPGIYILRAVKDVEYQAEHQIILPENTTMIENISMDLHDVTVSGQVLFDNQGVENAQMNFEKDETVTDNTAVTNGAPIMSSENGNYTVDLKPGTYNITIIKYDIENNNAQTLIYSLEDEKLALNIGQGTLENNDYNLLKKSVNINGQIKYNGVGVKETLTISFLKNETITDNTAATASIETLTNGLYSVELNPGEYIVSIDYLHGSTPVYILEDTDLTINEGDVTISQDYNVEKKSVTLTGTTKYGSQAINMSLTFAKDEGDITGISNSALSNASGYTIELAPGSYLISGSPDDGPVEINREMFTYIVDNSTNAIEVTKDMITIGYTYNIILKQVKVAETT